MPESVDYDTSVINVSPSGMKASAETLHTYSESVATGLKNIKTQLDSLQIAWQGDSAKAAEEVSNEWIRVISGLFGTEDEPDKGVLNALANGVSSAASNFTNAESGVTKAFNQFRSELSGGGDGGDEDPKDTPPEEVTDTNKTAVTMTFPDN
ncbi:MULTISPECIES: WXG100 family type VII secretion target [Streptomyces]|uniref:WXG100 family type VII secretion target n=1 Tax=Streptomyces TaxID=1883 RepID=UPI0004BD997F|nr:MULTISPECIES: WXG100 family type VII secretion target [unclassified Streptomyces]